MDIGYRYRMSDIDIGHRMSHLTALGCENLEKHGVAVILNQTAPHKAKLGLPSRTGSTSAQRKRVFKWLVWYAATLQRLLYSV